MESREAAARVGAIEALEAVETERRFVRGWGQNIIEISASEEKYHQQPVYKEYDQVPSVLPGPKPTIEDEFIPHLMFQNGSC